MIFIKYLLDLIMMKQWLKVALLSVVPVAASAHSMSPFILPEVFDTTANNITFQSAVTIEKFFVPSMNFKSDYLITAPNGQQQKVQAAANLKRFNIAEFDLSDEGTYRIRTDNAVANSMKYALIDGNWLVIRMPRPQQAKPDTTKAEAERKPTADEKVGAKMATKPMQPPRMIMADQVPANAKTIEVKNHLIAESFVTKTRPSPVPAVSNKGFEVKLLTHPNELYVGEALKAQVLNNGKGVANLELEVFKGASSYQVGAKREMPSVKTNNKGEFEVKFDQAGLYLITTSYPEANSDRSKKPAEDRYTYGLTVEVTE